MTCQCPQVVEKNYNSLHWKTNNPTVKYLGNLETSDKVTPAIRKCVGKGVQKDGHEYFLVACGKCMSCRLAKARSWADRCCLEINYLNSETRKFNNCCFLTLTYDDEHLPLISSDKKFYSGQYLEKRGLKNENKFVVLDLSRTTKVIDESTGEIKYLAGINHKTLKPFYMSTLQYSDVQRFIRSLKRSLARHGEQDFTYLVAGEYGGKTHRPHYHIVIFGYRPDDLTEYLLDNDGQIVKEVKQYANGVRESKVFLPATYSGYLQYMSPKLSKLWHKGRLTVSDVNWRTCGYVARYATKKLLDGMVNEESFVSLGYNADGKKVYDRCTYKDGRVREQLLCSKKPAIAQRFFEKYKSFIMAQNGTYCVSHFDDFGRTIVPNQSNHYFDVLIGRIDPALLEHIKEQRKIALEKLNSDLITDNGQINKVSQSLIKAEIESIKTKNFTRAEL